MAAYRSTIHQSTGFTPNFLVFGRENRAPIDLVLASLDEPEGVGASPDDFVNQLLLRQRQAYDLVRRNLGRAAERRKREYDLRVRAKTFAVGDWVFYYYPRQYKGRSKKWARTYTGPYLVVGVIPPCNFRLQRSPRGKVFVAHCDKLKTCWGDHPESWVITGGDAGVEAPVGDCKPGRERFVDPDEPGDDEKAEEDVNCDAPLDIRDSDGIPAEYEGGRDRVFRRRSQLRKPARYL
jgi:hypothetical protein